MIFFNISSTGFIIFLHIGITGYVTSQLNFILNFNWAEIATFVC